MAGLNINETGIRVMMQRGSDVDNYACQKLDGSVLYNEAHEIVIFKTR